MNPIEKTLSPIPVEQLTELVNELAAMAFFPAEREARGAIAEDIADICPNLNEARWLVKRFRQLFDRWPGPRELRAVYCSRNKPRDGIEAVSENYPDGVPTPAGGTELAWYPALAPASTPLLLPAGHVASADPTLDRRLQLLARSKDLNAPHRKKRAPEPTNPNYRPITQADIDRAIEEHRSQRHSGDIDA